jgi:hypothetical protein
MDNVESTQTPSARRRAPTAGTVNAELTFIVPQDTKPYFESSALTGGAPKVHFKTELRTVSIADMRLIRDQLDMDVHGFELHTHPTEVDDLYDDDAIKERYEAELIDLLKAETGADHVIVFDYTRRSDSPQGAANPDGLRGPATRVHCDYTPKSGPQRAADTVGAKEVERVLAGGGRIIQVNVWRPISGPVQRSPLALADASSIASGELIATDQVFPDRVGEIYQLAHGSGQRWYWAPEMSRDEVIFIKGWDSIDDGRAMFTPHGAFELGDTPIDAPARESIEARTYLIFEKTPS